MTMTDWVMERTMDIAKPGGWPTGRSTVSVNASGGDEEARRVQTAVASERGNVR
jgi:hypothetical protein